MTELTHGLFSLAKSLPRALAQKYGAKKRAITGRVSAAG
jgi:hypothetical protein